MSPEILAYLEEVRLHLRLDPGTERRVIREFCSHLEERVSELRADGLGERQASRVAIESFGRPRAIAREMYEAHSKGTWGEAALAALPHLLLAAVFVTQLWSEPLLAAIALLSVPCVTLYGWWHGKPGWMYPWIGYSLLPLFIGGYASAPVLWQGFSFLTGGAGVFPDAWLLLIVVVFLGSSVWVVGSTAVRVVRRDWILASLMLVPLPVVGGWLVNTTLGRGALSAEAFQNSAVPLAVALFSLGVTSAVFIRLRQRVLKVGALIIVGFIATAAVGHDLWGEAVFAGLLISALVLLAVLLSPALVEARVGHGELRDRLSPGKAPLKQTL